MISINEAINNLVSASNTIGVYFIGKKQQTCEMCSVDVIKILIK